MPSYILLELDRRAVDGYYFVTSLASDALSYHRAVHPGRWLMCQVRHEPDRPRDETALPLVSEERLRYSAATGAP